MSEKAARGARAWWFLGGVAVAALAFWAARTLEQGSQEAEAEALQREHQTVVAENIAPVRQALSAAATAPEPYDIETTMRAVRDIDRAITRVGSVREYFELLGRQDFRRVSPEVLATRKRILEVLAKYYAASERRRDEEELWRVFGRWSDELTKLMQTTDVSLATPLGSVSLAPSDPERQRLLVEERKRRENERRATFDELKQFEEELLFALDAAVPVFRTVEDEWARLCLQRDRAYLQAFETRWADAHVSAQAALEMAPFDEESQLLVALAEIEGDLVPDPASSERYGDVGQRLDQFLREHPNSAPALLLRGVWNLRRGNFEAGRTDLELSMTRYPDQAEALRDELDPYRNRKYLCKTRQGGQITGMYESMMLGACWFSPELQLARADFALGDEARAFQRVRDHFARRRAQGQWELVLYDIGFCEGLLGEPYKSFFPEKSYLDLEIERNTFGKDVSVAIDNRSDIVLHNATLVLCVRFTDMQPDDYATFVVGSTQPLVPALMRTDFGGVNLKYEGCGAERGADDVVPPIRAVLVADEAVSWIDSIQYKNEQLSRFSPLGTPREKMTPPTSLTLRVNEVLSSLGAGDVKLERVKNLISADDLKIELPRELALLAPLFRLEAGDQSFDESDDGKVTSRIEGDKIKLSFQGVGKALDGSPEELRLVARSAFGDVALVLRRNETGNYVFDRIEGP